MTLPIRVKFAPRIDIGPRNELFSLGEIFTAFINPPGVNTLYCLEEGMGELRIFPFRRQLHP
jgi:hypothetical protein